MPDTVFRPRVGAAAFAARAGPRIGIDEAHFNFHTALGRYRPFGLLAESDGYRVERVRRAFTDASLRGIDLLVIANPLNEVNDGGKWTLPTPSAFTTSEIDAVRRFVTNGGSLLLIADHMPFAGAAEALGEAVGVRFINGFSRDSAGASNFTLRRGSTLLSHPVTDGRTVAERVDSVVIFTGSAFAISATGTAGAAVLRLPPGTRVDQPVTAWEFVPGTASMRGDGLLFGAALELGKGRVFVAGEAAMFSAQRSGPRAQGRMGFNAPDAPQNAQFVLNVLHWLSRVP